MNYFTRMGVIAITHQPRFKGATEQEAISCGEKIATVMNVAGLKNTRIEVKKMEPVAAICVLGDK